MNEEREREKKWKRIEKNNIENQQKQTEQKL